MFAICGSIGNVHLLLCQTDMVWSVSVGHPRPQLGLFTDLPQRWSFVALQTQAKLVRLTCQRQVPLLALVLQWKKLDRVPTTLEAHLS